MATQRRRNRDSEAAAVGDEPMSVAISEVAARQRVCICGKVTRMTARPTSGQPALAVSITDDTGSVTAVWTGRRSIGGVTLGRRIAIEGVAGLHGAHLEFTNPNYTLLPRHV
ncbi:MAG: OB-fold nucleic acid binding domain-containing protein [Actinobacteria bacterium]|nr:OB-fold nucleic acid binding domain-containing protein [Actinomycetota bacterium]